MDNTATVYESTPSVIPTAIIAAVIGALIGGLIGFNLNKPDSISLSDTDTTTPSADYQAGFDAARAKLVAKGFIPSSATTQLPETTYANGIVKSISGDTLMVEIASFDILGDPAVRSVKVTADTTINQLTNKTLEAIQAETEAFSAKMKNFTPTENTPFPEPPQPFNREQITIQSIKIGDNVSINTEAIITPDGDITAKTIEVSVLPTIMNDTQPL
jgi:hypothetical protein